MKRPDRLMAVFGGLGAALSLLATAPACAQGAYANLSPTASPPCHNAVPQPRPPRDPNAPPPPPSPPRPPLPSAAEAVLPGAGGMPKHDCFVERARMGNIDLLFVGDSITDFFGRADRGQAVWLEYYGDRNAANFGISGDITQEVLWRMQNEELEGFEAEAIVLMIGTNNIRRNDNANIAQGNAAIIAEFRKRQPNAKILLLGVFPRGGPDSSGRQAVEEINTHLADLADDEHVFYMDLTDTFTKDDGELIEGVMVDGLHPSAMGYQLWAEAIEPWVARYVD